MSHRAYHDRIQFLHDISGPEVDYGRILRDFAANIIRLLELQLHTTHMLAGKRLLECPICIRATEEDVARDTTQRLTNG